MNIEQLIGHRVVVEGSGSPAARWVGRGIAVAVDPVILIEQDNGFRVMLPLAWAKPEVLPHDSSDIVSSSDPMKELALAERRLSRHLAGWKECDLGNEVCEHVLRRNAAYLAYTKRPHPSTLPRPNAAPPGFFRCACGKMHMISPHVTPGSRCTCGRPLLGRMLDAAG